MNTLNPQQFQRQILAYYAAHKRPLPWRETTNPYHVWLAEIMLQQTTVATVLPYYTKFLARFPTIQHLAEATLAEVLHLWQGLGYYRRAHHLHRCAQVIVNDYQGQFPTTETALLKLPGIGAYTAAAIVAFAYDQPSTVVDGNIERIMSRIFAVTKTLPAAKPILYQHAAVLASQSNPRDYANALMDLGATVCTPTNPTCTNCPVINFCAAFKQGNPANFPKKSPKKAKPHKHGTAYCLFDANGDIYLRQRTHTKLLDNLWEMPHTGWEIPQNTPKKEFFTHFQQNSLKNVEISHVFTHFKLTLQVKIGRISGYHPQKHAFSISALPPIPTLMQKVLTAALENNS